MADTYDDVEHEYLDGVDPDDRPDWRVTRAILMLVAAVRDLDETLDRRLSSIRDGQAER